MSALGLIVFLSAAAAAHASGSPAFDKSLERQLTGLRGELASLSEAKPEAFCAREAEFRGKYLKLGRSLMDADKTKYGRALAGSREFLAEAATLCTPAPGTAPGPKEMAQVREAGEAILKSVEAAAPSGTKAALASAGTKVGDLTASGIGAADIDGLKRFFDGEALRGGGEAVVLGGGRPPETGRGESRGAPAVRSSSGGKLSGKRYQEMVADISDMAVVSAEGRAAYHAPMENLPPLAGVLSGFAGELARRSAAEAANARRESGLIEVLRAEMAWAGAHFEGGAFPLDRLLERYESAAEAPLEERVSRLSVLHSDLSSLRKLESLERAEKTSNDPFAAAMKLRQEYAENAAYRKIGESWSEYRRLNSVQLSAYAPGTELDASEIDFPFSVRPAGRVRIEDRDGLPGIAYADEIGVVRFESLDGSFSSELSGAGESFRRVETRDSGGKMERSVFDAAGRPLAVSTFSRDDAGRLRLEMVRSEDGSLKRRAGPQAPGLFLETGSDGKLRTMSLEPGAFADISDRSERGRALRKSIEWMIERFGREPGAARESDNATAWRAAAIAAFVEKRLDEGGGDASPAALVFSPELTLLIQESGEGSVRETVGKFEKRWDAKEGKYFNYDPALDHEGFAIYERRLAVDLDGGRLAGTDKPFVARRQFHGARTMFRYADFRKAPGAKAQAGRLEWVSSGEGGEEVRASWDVKAPEVPSTVVGKALDVASDAWRSAFEAVVVIPGKTITDVAYGVSQYSAAYSPDRLASEAALRGISVEELRESYRLSGYYTLRNNAMALELARLHDPEVYKRRRLETRQNYRHHLRSIDSRLDDAGSPTAAGLARGMIGVVDGLFGFGLMGGAMGAGAASEYTAVRGLTMGYALQMKAEGSLQTFNAAVGAASARDEFLAAEKSLGKARRVNAGGDVRRRAERRYLDARAKYVSAVAAVTEESIEFARESVLANKTLEKILESFKADAEKTKDLADAAGDSAVGMRSILPGILAERPGAETRVKAMEAMSQAKLILNTVFSDSRFDEVFRPFCEEHLPGVSPEKFRRDLWEALNEDTRGIFATLMEIEQGPDGRVTGLRPVEVEIRPPLLTIGLSSPGELPGNVKGQYEIDPRENGGDVSVEHRIRMNTMDAGTANPLITTGTLLHELIHYKFKMHELGAHSAQADFVRVMGGMFEAAGFHPDLTPRRIQVRDRSGLTFAQRIGLAPYDEGSLPWKWVDNEYRPGAEQRARQADMDSLIGARGRGIDALAGHVYGKGYGDDLLGYPKDAVPVSRHLAGRAQRVEAAFRDIRKAFADGKLTASDGFWKAYEIGAAKLGSEAERGDLRRLLNASNRGDLSKVILAAENAAHRETVRRNGEAERILNAKADLDRTGRLLSVIEVAKSDPSLDLLTVLKTPRDRSLFVAMVNGEVPPSGSVETLRHGTETNLRKAWAKARSSGWGAAEAEANARLRRILIKDFNIPVEMFDAGGLLSLSGRGDRRN